MLGGPDFSGRFVGLPLSHNGLGTQKYHLLRAERAEVLLGGLEPPPRNATKMLGGLDPPPRNATKMLGGLDPPLGMQQKC